MTTFEQVYAQDVKEKPQVMEAQKKLLEQRYNLTPKLDPELKMTRGKPIAVGPTARLPNGTTFDKLAQPTPLQARAIDLAANAPVTT